MHIVTGAAGFIGSNVVRALNARGIRDVVAVDDLEHGDKFLNLRGCEIADFFDKREFREAIRRGTLGVSARAMFHQGACADTTEQDGRYMMENNFTYSKELLHWALDRQIPFVYASSASVYGAGRECRETPDYENPLNVYAYSKLVFDQYARRLFSSAKSTIVGLRYFNVYGPGEQHKGRMASMVHQLYDQLTRTGVARLFEGTDGYADGEQRRDFIWVGDVVDVNLFFAEGGPKRGIFNVGTGQSRSFNDIAKTLIALLGKGEIHYIAFPESLQGKYQSFTESDISRLRAAGYDRPFTSLEDGIRQLCAQKTAGSAP
jgi:ADP-L-glycero-D-manno-heptose 6-epimerase